MGCYGAGYVGATFSVCVACALQVAGSYRGAFADIAPACEHVLGVHTCVIAFCSSRAKPAVLQSNACTTCVPSLLEPVSVSTIRDKKHRFLSTAWQIMMLKVFKSNKVCAFLPVFPLVPGRFIWKCAFGGARTHAAIVQRAVASQLSTAVTLHSVSNG